MLFKYPFSYDELFSPFPAKLSKGKEVGLDDNKIVAGVGLSENQISAPSSIYFLTHSTFIGDAQINTFKSSEAYRLYCFFWLKDSSI